MVSFLLVAVLASWMQTIRGVVLWFFSGLPVMGVWAGRVQPVRGSQEPHQAVV